MEEELVALERRFWEAGGDPDFYREWFAPEGRCVFGFGMLDKDATVDAMASAAPWTDVTFEDLLAVPLAEGAAAITYAARATRGDEIYEAMVSSVYARRDGTWKLAVHQQTPRL